MFDSGKAKQHQLAVGLSRRVGDCIALLGKSGQLILVPFIFIPIVRCQSEAGAEGDGDADTHDHVAVDAFSAGITSR